MPRKRKVVHTEVVTGEVLTDDEISAKKAIPQKDKNAFGSYITKSNELIQKTKYFLPRNEQKVLFMLLSKIDQKNDRDASKYYTISFSDFSKLTGVNAADSGYANYLKNTIENLENRTFWVALGNDKYKTMSWVSHGSIVDMKEKTISMRFNQDIWKDIAQLTSNYTSYSIEYLLMMQSTYSMRVYEIILSYDNGTRDYGYNNGLVFEPVTEEILNKFSEKREQLQGFKYKRFGIDEFKDMLSVPTKEEQGRASKKNEAAAKFSREKPLSEKYPVFTDFEKNVLKIVKREINEMTDLWFDYEPVRKKGVRKYTYLYIFIKYKSKEEMKKVRSFHTMNQGPDDEVVRPQKKRRRKIGIDKAALSQYGTPLSPAVMDMTFRKARIEIEAKAEYFSYDESLSQDDKNMMADVFTYTAKILTNTTKREQAEETFDALNRIISANNGLKVWAFGMCERLSYIVKTSTERKSAQYYRTVVYNEILQNTASVIEDGKRKENAMNHNGQSGFKFDMSVFDEI